MTDYSFNLWTEPWITVEKQDGTTEPVSLLKALSQAHTYREIYDSSPLAIVGIHRLLTAILQDIFDPQHEEEIANIWKEEHFSIEKIEQFGASYSHRFDLFSEEYPFMQSADLPLQWSKGEKPSPKSVATLFPDAPSGTGVTHYRHGIESELVLGATSLAKGLLSLSAFASSGGSGIKPSINGVPPIYVIPGGDTMFHSLVVSMIVPTRQPDVRDSTNDLVWWRHEPLILEKNEINNVGYLHSLTFPSRRVRLHPVALEATCAYSGQMSELGAETMIFQMGESRPKEAPFWFDPFAAYRLPNSNSKSKKPKPPTPVRPVDRRQLWREFAALFLQDHENRTQQPAVLSQLSYLVDEYDIADGVVAYPFRCIGMRTDMKAKIFEWIETGFSVPPSLLSDPEVGYLVQQSINFSNECSKQISATFRYTFGGTGKDERSKKQKQHMLDAFWQELTIPFRQFVNGLVDINTREEHELAWVDKVVEVGLKSFQDAAKQMGSGAHTLRQSVQGENRCRIALYKKRKDWKGEE